MKLIDFINSTFDWKTQLHEKNIKISGLDDFYLLKYGHVADFSDELVCQCRGVIIKHQEENYKIVCLPFDKFMNYGQEGAANIDWDSAIVQEKIDGSLIKMWHDGAFWNISTNGNIDAFEANVNDTAFSFGGLTVNSIHGELADFFNILDKRYTYMFELVSPYSTIVIPYSFTGLYFLAARCNETYNELDPKEVYQNTGMEKFGIYLPKFYDIHSLSDCIKAAHEMDKNHEGFVVRDKYFNRVKIKSPAYLALHHTWNNGNITDCDILTMILDETDDDFIASFPHLEDRFDDVNRWLTIATYNAYREWDEVKNISDKKEFALAAKNKKFSDFLFKKYRDNSLDAFEYFKNFKSKKTLLNKIKESVNEGF